MLTYDSRERERESEREIEPKRGKVGKKCRFRGLKREKVRKRFEGFGGKAGNDIMEHLFLILN